jgi:hypothetical protein
VVAVFVLRPYGGAYCIGSSWKVTDIFGSGGGGGGARSGQLGTEREFRQQEAGQIYGVRIVQPDPDVKYLCPKFRNPGT